MIHIVNGKVHGFKDGVYIGRGGRGMKTSALHNPFVIGQSGNRDEVINLYREYLWQCIKIKNEVYDELVRLSKIEGDLKLICFCKPLACHGDVVKSAIEWIKTNH